MASAHSNVDGILIDSVGSRCLSPGTHLLQHPPAMFQQRTHRRLEDLQLEIHELAQFQHVHQQHQHSQQSLALLQSRDASCAAVSRVRDNVKSHCRQLEEQVSSISDGMDALRSVHAALASAVINRDVLQCLGVFPHYSI